MEQTFKTQALSETLSVLPHEKCCIMSFLSAVTKITGSLEFSKKRMNLCLQLDSYDETIKIVELFEQLYPIQLEIAMEHVKSGAKAGNRICLVRIPAGFSKQVLIDLCLMRGENDELYAFNSDVPRELLTRPCCRTSYITGLFLVCGSVYVPSIGEDGEKKDGYHFEMRFDDEDFAEEALALLAEMGINAKISERGAARLVYVKDKYDILSILALLGLADSALKLKSIIDERETANSINRTTICEAANLDKTYTAASRQLLAIGTIEERDGLDSLSPILRDTACARMEYPQASLSELADILGISKSCLNHRLRKITELAQTER